jgi:hypothetical protein
MSQKFFTTTAGVRVPIQPISIAELELAEAGVNQDFRDANRMVDPPQKPTYVVSVLGGSIQEHEHDETTLEVTPELITETDDPEEKERIAKERTAENKTAWGEYLNLKTEHERVLAEMHVAKTKIRNEILMEGLAIQLPEDDAWEKRQRKLRIRIPEDAEERLLHYKTTVILKTVEDLMGFIEAITTTSMSGIVSEDKVRALTNSFRNHVQKHTEADWDTFTGNQDQG